VFEKLDETPVEVVEVVDCIDSVVPHNSWFRLAVLARSHPPLALVGDSWASDWIRIR
jgi:hypothetical protein